jgi:hypothetical protein
MKQCTRDETGLFLLDPHNTDFDQQLKQRELTSIILIGMLAHTCLESPACLGTEHQPATFADAIVTTDNPITVIL